MTTNFIQSTILDTVLELINEGDPLLPSRLYDSVKVALDVFQIEQFVRIEVEEIRSRPSKPRTNRILSSSTVENMENIDCLIANL